MIAESLLIMKSAVVDVTEDISTCPSLVPDIRSLNIGDPISVFIVKRDDIEGYFTASSYGGGSSISCPDSTSPFLLPLDS